MLGQNGTSPILALSRRLAFSERTETGLRQVRLCKTLL
jgi:hypothetical protein